MSAAMEKTPLGNDWDHLQPVGELTIIWDREKAELMSRIAQLERDVASIVDHLWKGNAVEHRSRLAILEAAVEFWSNQSMRSHLDKIEALGKRIQTLEDRGTNV